MVGAQRFFTYGERPLVERLGVSVAALLVVQQGQIIERLSYIRVSRPSAFSRIASERL